MDFKIKDGPGCSAGPKAKGFFAKLIGWLDAKLQEKAKQSACCKPKDQDKGKGSSCC